jgi:DNA-directed RNA polymerase beta subunit
MSVGWNQEDSILITKAMVERGMFIGHKTDIVKIDGGVIQNGDVIVGKFTNTRKNDDAEAPECMRDFNDIGDVWIGQKKDK